MTMKKKMGYLTDDADIKMIDERRCEKVASQIASQVAKARLIHMIKTMSDL